MHPYASARNRTAPRKPSRHSESTFSVARLAAEAAFSGPNDIRPTPKPAPAAAIVVVRRRTRADGLAGSPESVQEAKPGAGHADSGALRSVDDSVMAAGDAPSRAPRIFRLPEASDPADSRSDAAAPDSDAATAIKAEFHAIDATARVGHDRSAGALVVTKPAPVAVVAALAGDSAVDRAPSLRAIEAESAPGKQLRQAVHRATPAMLAVQLRELAALDGVFRDIRQARTFRIDDGALRAEWKRIQHELKSVALELATWAHRRAPYPKGFC